MWRCTMLRMPKGRSLALAAAAAPRRLLCGTPSPDVMGLALRRRIAGLEMLHNEMEQLEVWLLPLNTPTRGVSV